MAAKKSNPPAKNRPAKETAAVPKKQGGRLYTQITGIRNKAK
jgi:hypothetical protein